jgi:hypothetical protein
MNEMKPCPACGTSPHIYFNDVVWRAECRNRACTSAEATTGISGIAKHNVINNWNNVICPSVTNSLQEEYEQQNTTNS